MALFHVPDPGSGSGSDPGSGSGWDSGSGSGSGSGSDASSGSWRVGAESPHRAPVLYALGEMTHTMRARGQEPVVALWGPKDGAWARQEGTAQALRRAADAHTDTSDADADAGADLTDAEAHTDVAVGPGGSADGPGASAAGQARGSASHVERMLDRRHQALMAGLGQAGLYDLTPDDVTAVQAVVERLDETTVRRVAHWLATAGRVRTGVGIQEQAEDCF